MGEHKESHAQDENTRVGLALKNARQERGLTHEDVERETKIRTRYLEALERDDYDALPGAVYAQGFVKTYANYLDLDGEALSREVKNRRTGYADHEERPAKPAPEALDNERYRNGRNLARTGQFRRPRRRRLSPITIIGAGLGLLILAIVVTGLYFVGLQASNSSNETPNQSQESAGANPAPEADGSQASGGEPVGEETPDSAEPDVPAQQGGGEPAAGEGGEAAAPASEPAPGEPAPAEPAPAELPPPESLTMELRVDGNVSWLNIETDGNLAFEGVGQPGFSQTFEAEDSITVWSGNAGAVYISINGQDYGQLGESGEIKVQNFSLKPAEN